MTNRPARIVVMISGTGSNLAALLQACAEPAYPAQVVGVIADCAAPGLAHAQAADVPTATVKLADFPDRAQWNQGLLAALAVFRPDWIVLAGFMRLLGPAVVTAYPDRIINTHPSLLPNFPGAHAVADALAAGVTTTGCSIITVDEGVDTGPVLAQSQVPVLPDDTVETLHERIKAVEHKLLVDTLQKLITADPHSIS